VVVVPGDDGQGVFEAVHEARGRALAGLGPTLIDARLPEQPQPLDWRAHQARGGWTAEHHQEVALDVERAIRDARKSAEASGDIRLASLFEDVFADRPWFLRDEANMETH
jgi:TPP-dependent pyruvate/acetoin dehydrogenase alpha subunit